MGLVAANSAIGLMGFFYSLSPKSWQTKRNRIIIIVIFMALGLLNLRLAMSETNRRTELFALCDWIGNRSPLVLSGKMSLGEGDWTVFLIDGRCSKCRKIVDSEFPSAIGTLWLTRPDIPSLIVRRKQGEPSWLYRLDIPAHEKTLSVVPARAQISDGMIRACEPIR
jgi:hypothetical protein